jgi:opacity protein-like surface antigen
VTTFVVGIMILAASAGSYVSAEYGALAPTDIGFIQSSFWPSEGFGIGGSFGYEFENGFRTEIEGLSSHTDATRSGNLLSTGGLGTDRLMLTGIYEFSDGSWRLKPYVGAGFGTIDAGERLLGNGAYDRVTAYQLRGGVTLGVTQKLLGSLEYRWTNGSKPYLSLAGIPAKFEVDRHGFLAGMNYRF